MTNRARPLLPLLAGALLLGCGPAENETGADGAVPPGAIPAAPEVRPGTESAPGNVQQSGSPGQPTDPAAQGSGAASPGVIDTAAAAGRDTAR